MKSRQVGKYYIIVQIMRKSFSYLYLEGIITKNIFLFRVETEEEMSKDIVIKSNKYGIKLILDSQLPFPELLQVVGNKFKEMDNFFKNAKMAISFENRDLTVDEELQIVDIIMKNSQIQIVSIIDKDNVLEEKMKEHLDAYYQLESAKMMNDDDSYTSKEMEENEVFTDFYRGNLRSGQILESNSSITIIGDVNPGAKIISKGNIVILGSLRGNAHAGAAGNNNCFIFALDMQPIQLQIGDLIAKSPDKEKTKRNTRKREKLTVDRYDTRIAIAQDGNICIDAMTKGYLNNLPV
jgi:septum site-determining protein MinC